MKKMKFKNFFLFQNLADTDSTSLFVIFICKLSRCINEKTARNIIFEVLTKSKVLNRLDLSNDFWEQFNVQNKSLKKQVGLYEVENINKTNMLTIAINPKEYFKKHKGFSINKKHKGLKSWRRQRKASSRPSYKNSIIKKKQCLNFQHQKVAPYI